ncbi:MAG TPA: hypothetical protein DCL54_17840, partial [Alphaproteobacteria bacterium]|nr:hypothetical protein [Alphaproteobacteria bacterium]
ATFVLEDAATVAAALLSAAGYISWELALLALYVGIFAGDLALYALGAMARRSKMIADFVGMQRIEKGERWLGHRLTVSLIAARFLPGARLPAYTASGFLRVPFMHFALVAAIAAAVWTPLLFSAVYMFGTAIIERLGVWKYVAGGALIILVLFWPWIAKRWIPRQA